MPMQPRKMSEIMKEMLERLLRHPDASPSSEAAHVALIFANIAWNETVGLIHSRDKYRSAWEQIEADYPEMWSEFKSNDVNAMLDELIVYKKKHYANDRRRILICGIPNGKIHVEWLAPAAPGVDSKWEMELFGLVKTGQQTQAVKFLQTTRGLNRHDAEAEVANVAVKLGVV